MLIYVSLALNIYIWILHYMYKKRNDHELGLAGGAKGKEVEKPKEAVKEETSC